FLGRLGLPQPRCRAAHDRRALCGRHDAGRAHWRAAAACAQRLGDPQDGDRPAAVRRHSCPAQGTGHLGMKEDQGMNPERNALNRECEASQQAQETEAARYATLLDWGTRLGLLLLLITFASYLLGGLPPHVPLEHLPGAWHLPVEQ